MNAASYLDTIWQDLRHGLRILLKNPTFAVVAILTLALGTGANAAIFQLVNAVRLKALPVEQPGELVSIGINTNGKGRVGRGMRGRSIHTEPLYQAIRAQQQAFSSVFAWGSDRWDLSTEGELRPAQGIYVSGSFFGALGVRAQVGRVLTEADDQRGCGTPGAVLSHGFWQARYGGKREVVGRPITLDRHVFEIVGVAPPQFFGVEVGRNFDVAIPLCAEALMRGEQAGTGVSNVWWLDIMGRLKPDWTVRGAEAQLAAISPGIFQATVSPRYNAEIAKTYAAFTFTAKPASTGVSDVRNAYAVHLWVLLGATGLVLLIACANLANLMLARATARDREIAVRLAIGASRGRIVRQMLSESVLLAALGAAAGLALAQWLIQGLVMILSTSDNRLFVDLTPDWRVFTFITLLAVAACLLFGLSPALKATGANPGKAMQAGGRSPTEAPQAFAVRRGLVVLQVALSMVLVVGALLFGRSLRNLGAVNAGFRQDGVVVVDVDLRPTAVQPAARQQAFAEIMTRVRAVPGVRHAAETLVVPMSGGNWNERIAIGGALQDGTVRFNQVGGDYFVAMETPLLAGRTFDARDRTGSAQVAIVNESFARRYFPNSPPVGQTFQVETAPGSPRPLYHIVGLVKNAKYLDVREEFGPIVHLAMSQEAEPAAFLDIVVRSDLPVPAITPTLTRAIMEATPGAAVSYDTITSYVRDSLVAERLMASLSGFFGALAMVIAMIGLYGVMSYMVTRRTLEIGIRMALGAAPHAVVRMVLRECGVLVAAGVAIGVALAAVASRWAATLLYALEPWDPVSFALAVGGLGVVSLVAAWIPARRASHLEPTIALRD